MSRGLREARIGNDKLAKLANTTQTWTASKAATATQNTTTTISFDADTRLDGLDNTDIRCHVNFFADAAASLSEGAVTIGTCYIDGSSNQLKVQLVNSDADTDIDGVLHAIFITPAS